MLSLFLQSRLPQDAFQRLWMQVLTRMARYRYTPLLHRVPILPMVSLLPNRVPPITLDELNHVTDFHAQL
jgi:hypothetical protein